MLPPQGSAVVTIRLASLTSSLRLMPTDIPVLYARAYYTAHSIICNAHLPESTDMRGQVGTLSCRTELSVVSIIVQYAEPDVIQILSIISTCSFRVVLHRYHYIGSREGLLLLHVSQTHWERVPSASSE